MDASGCEITSRMLDLDEDATPANDGVSALASREEPLSSGTQRVVGLTVINARSVLDRDGRRVVAVSETVEASADELAPALATA